MKYAAAYGANDLDRYFSFFADDMTVWWGTQGRLDDPTPKARYMKTWPDSVKAGGGYHSCELADLRIQAGPAATLPWRRTSSNAFEETRRPASSRRSHTK